MARFRFGPFFQLRETPSAPFSSALSGLRRRRNRPWRISLLRDPHHPSLSTWPAYGCGAGRPARGRRDGFVGQEIQTVRFRQRSLTVRTDRGSSCGKATRERIDGPCVSVRATWNVCWRGERNIQWCIYEIIRKALHLVSMFSTLFFSCCLRHLRLYFDWSSDFLSSTYTNAAVF